MKQGFPAGLLAFASRCIIWTPLTQVTVIEDNKVKYWAFISYSHTDKRWARWLHRKLESYRLPAKLVRHSGGKEAIPRRIAPVFRDQDELPTSTDLGDAITRALESSRHLIVICSPRAAQSRWVNEEVLTFKRIGKADRVHLFIVAGEPHASEDSDTAADECFPSSATHAIDADGNISEQLVEPIAADAREGKDTKHDAMLRLVSGMLGIGFDELKRREVQRRQRRLLAAFASTAAIALIMAGLTVAAVLAKRDADRARESKAAADAKLLNQERANTELAEASAKRDREHSIELERELRRQKAFRLTAESQTLRGDLPQRSMLLAVAAVYATHSEGEPVDPRVEQNLRDALRRMGGKHVAVHPGLVTRAPQIPMAVSSDAKRLVTGTLEGVALMWDLTADDPSAKPRILRGHQGPIPTMALSADGKRLVTASPDETIRVWNLEADEGEEGLQRFDGPPVWRLALSADGKRLVTAGMDGAAYMWTLKEDGSKADFKVLGSDIEQVALSADGKRLATHGDKTIKLWDLDAEDPSAEPKVVLEGRAVTALALSADGKRLAAATLDSVARMWDIDDDFNTTPGKPIQERMPIISLALDANGQRVATACRGLRGNENTARVWDLAADGRVVELSGHEGFIGALAFRDDGKRVVTASIDGTARLWDLETDKVGDATVLRGHEQWVMRVMLSADGKRLVTGSDDATVRVWDLNADNPSAAAEVLKHEAAIKVLAMNTSETLLVTGSYDTTARVWELQADGAFVLRKELAGHDGPVVALALTADDKRLVTVGGDWTVRDWDLAANDDSQPTVKKLADGKGHLAVSALSRDGKRLVTVRANKQEENALARHWPLGEDSQAMLWNLAAEDPSASPIPLVGHKASISVMAISADGKLLVTGSEDATARVWDLDADDPSDSRELKGHMTPINAVAVSPDGRLVVTGTVNGTTRVWDLESGDENDPLELPGHFGLVNTLALSADGTRLVTGGADRTARVWDLAAGQPANSAIVLDGHRAPVVSLALSADGKRLVTGSLDQTARVWMLDVEDLVAAARRVVGRELTDEEREMHGLVEPDGQ